MLLRLEDAVGGPQGTNPAVVYGPNEIQTRPVVSEKEHKDFSRRSAGLPVRQTTAQRCNPGHCCVPEPIKALSGIKGPTGTYS
jgi:hypothetical protein